VVGEGRPGGAGREAGCSQNIETLLGVELGRPFANVIKLTTYIVNYKPGTATLPDGPARAKHIPAEKPAGKHGLLGVANRLARTGVHDRDRGGGGGRCRRTGRRADGQTGQNGQTGRPR